MDSYLASDCSDDVLMRASYIASLKETSVTGVYEATILKGFLSFSKDFIDMIDCEKTLEAWMEYELE